MPDGVCDGYVRVVDRAVEEICYGDVPSDAERALVIPGFVNAHTHVGDSVAFPAPRGSVQEIVGPPDGHKHRVLRSTPAKVKEKAMRKSIELMARTGCSAFIDFREEGIEGLRSLRSACSGSPVKAVALGRPAGPIPSDDELADLVHACDGFGVSAARDWPADLLMKLSKKAKAEGKMFALHASETVREDIDTILKLRPDFLVHMNQATEGDLEAVAAEGAPIVICPSSNEFFRLGQDIPRLLRHGVTVALGTDNGMIARPDMFEEMRCALRSSSATPLEIAVLATWGGRKVLNAKGKILTEITPQDDLTAVRVKGYDPVRELVTAAGAEDVLAVARGGKVWRSKDWKK